MRILGILTTMSLFVTSASALNLVAPNLKNNPKYPQTFFAQSFPDPRSSDPKGDRVNVAAILGDRGSQITVFQNEEGAGFSCYLSLGNLNSVIVEKDAFEQASSMKNCTKNRPSSVKGQKPANTSKGVCLVSSPISKGSVCEPPSGLTKISCDLYQLVVSAVYVDLALNDNCVVIGKGQIAYHIPGDYVLQDMLAQRNGVRADGTSAVNELLNYIDKQLKLFPTSEKLAQMKMAYEAASAPNGASLSAAQKAAMKAIPAPYCKYVEFPLLDPCVIDDLKDYLDKHRLHDVRPLLQQVKGKTSTKINKDGMN